jgi:hypothetical protein
MAVRLLHIVIPAKAGIHASSNTAHEELIRHRFVTGDAGKRAATTGHSDDPYPSGQRRTRQ